ncbi:hypothetical protein [Methylococcus sp. Mc7]|uniref:hypothetical protein n=1 Tax=Methylococcus sp. Mc7 TaxID=2860258 RepID=UPI001C52FF4D|nr:hypothetical protein [Methylococcus sp. Mc7]QXP84018.1 hypothetical protein KW115_18165 [Methylococcus sp. Mc7]
MEYLYYDFDEVAIRRQLRDLGFTACAYRPFERTLMPLSWNPSVGNTLFVRDLGYVETRLRAAPAFRVLGREL